MKTKKNSGFTMLDLIIVVAIIGILTAIAAPSFSSYMTSSRLKGAARQVMSDLMAARMQAVSRNTNVTLVFDSDTQYTIIDDKNGNGSADTGETTVIKNIQTNYPGVTFTVEGDHPTYTPRGTTDLTSTTTITLTNSRGSKTVDVKSTGRVRIS